ncbi:maleylpyruvate isomerase family mycothiol-dependent enzyme [Nocardioides sp. SR21]|uniref:maleylpyruvate isomerase family mycothiol-dependent enzyme n=1 Tax=Nocardioides sp. SR21 TaxID=2919501 RepID=UPI001FA957B5|nr:maleylpyruvate isomerase family mycothiol-dependent enzyme [Nocardioides sp. SR21]
MAETPQDPLPDATRRLIRTADALAETAYAEPSGLPGWSRAHVLAHLTLNAEGLAGALNGLGGEATTMYTSEEARDADIATLAGQDPAVVRDRLLAACTAFGDALAAVPADAWDAEIERTPGGRRFPAAMVPTMRLREVEIHHADLDAGYTRADWSPEFSVSLLDAAVERPGQPAFVAEPTDLDRRWEAGTGGPTVTGAVADLGWWVTGRGGGSGLSSNDGAVPTIGAI